MTTTQLGGLFDGLRSGDFNQLLTKIGHIVAICTTYSGKLGSQASNISKKWRLCWHKAMINLAPPHLHNLWCYSIVASEVCYFFWHENA